MEKISSQSVDDGFLMDARVASSFTRIWTAFSFLRKKTLPLEVHVAEKFVDRLLTREAEDQPSDNVKPEALVMELPPWYDEELYKKGRQFYHDHSFSLAGSMLFGLVAVFAVPSILRVLISTRRSNSNFTAYRRYLSTILHTMSWFDHDLKPGTMAWRSLETVRTRHIRASESSKLKGIGIVSQRDLALTMFGFIGFSMLKPDAFGLRQNNEGDWEGYNHFWRVIGHMIGLKEEYNLARESIEETRQACQLLQDRVFTPCLENVPEHFEHSARVMLDGLWCVNPTIDVEGNLWWCKYLADVPGYIFSEKDRIKLQERLKKQLGGKNLDTGVDITSLIQKPAIDGLPDLPPRKLFYHHYTTVESSPEYQQLNFKSKTKLYLNYLYIALYTSWLGRWYFNANFKFSLFLMRYFPYLAFFRFGIKSSLVNIFAEDPKDDTKVKLNSEYSKKSKETPWYEKIFILFW